MLVWRRPFGDLPDIKRLRACANKRPRTTTELFSCQGLQSMSAVGHEETLGGSSKQFPSTRYALEFVQPEFLVIEHGTGEAMG